MIIKLKISILKLFINLIYLKLKGKNLQNEDENYYKINIKEKKINEYLKDYKIQQNEKNFVLDCLNKNISKELNNNNKSYFHYFFSNNNYNYNKMNKSSSTKILNKKYNASDLDEVDADYIRKILRKHKVEHLIYTYNTKKSEISESNKESF